MTKKKSTKKNEETNYKGIATVILTLAFAYLVITNWTLIMVGGIVGILLLVIIVAVAAYYILQVVGVTALTGLIGATATLIGLTRKK